MRHYFNKQPVLNDDDVIDADETHALHPLHVKPDGHLVPDTYPFGV